MTTLLIALFVAFAVGFAAWRVVVVRRTAHKSAGAKSAAPAASAARAPATVAPAARQRTPEQEAARAKAERIIAAEAARRKAAIQKAQNVARVEAERRAAEAARTAAAPVPKPPATRPPMPPERPAPVVPQAAAGPAVVERAAPPTHAAPAPTAARAAPAVLKTAAQTLVMLVDDSRMVRVKSTRLLAAHEFQVVTAVDGSDALQQLEHCCPDLIITDVDMPGMDGFALVAAIRDNPRTRQIPLVMITSAEDRHRDDATRMGVGLVMGKPYDEAALIAHIRSFRFFARAEEADSLACA